MVALDPAHLVGTGGAVGALLRYLVTERIEGEEFPAGTLTVNVVGTFVLGVLTFAGAADEVVLLVGTGACGSFTTFSSFSFETVRLWEAGDRARAAMNAVGTLLLAALALAVARLLAAVVVG
jgi:CrcB protein